MIKNFDLRHFFKVLSKRMSHGEINQSSIIIAYYLLFSMFPILIIVGNILPLFHLKTELIEEYLVYVLPTKISEFMIPIVKSVLQKQSTGYISFGILIALWSFSSLTNAMRINMNRIYGVRQEELHFSLGRKMLERIAVILITGLMIVLLVILTFALTFGQELIESLKRFWGISYLGFESIFAYKWLVLLITMLIVIAYFNFALPNVKKHKRAVWPGVFTTLIGWAILSYLFGLYLSHFKISFENYGIVGTFIIFMLWLNLSSLLFLFGVCINATIDELEYGIPEIR
ncbi:YihY/virulence factor BrkB family protein [Lactobacillus psittaci]|uniref:Methionine aminopeptidase Map n=1 Tax=Lactobacillus psittaci DSM 15354 TaxID=1122152 RepID=A0A0R1S5Q1_9LACO|nr:YihY/virulence factor BrkB family protein [Lactobacillus psittaci]KRL63838.1 methionine aminopeptidase Map [Lactobacillus psittaci DSM 15354]